MLFQNDKQLSERMQKWGCFIRSCMIIAELKTGKELDYKLINLIEDLAIKAGFVDDKDYKVIKSAPIIKLAFEYLGSKKKVIEIGTSVNGKVSYYPSIKKDLQITDAKILKMKQNGPSKTHFVAIVDDKIYDPHNPSIKNQGEIWTIHYRII